MQNNNLRQENGNSFRSSVTSQDSSKSKYTKFKSIARQGTHTDRSRQEWEQSSSRAENSIALGRKRSQAKSHTSIRSNHSPNKLPSTPLKNIYKSFSRKGQVNSSFKSLLQEIELLKHQFNIFVEKMEREMNRAI